MLLKIVFASIQNCLANTFECKSSYFDQMIEKKERKIRLNFRIIRYVNTYSWKWLND